MGNLRKFKTSELINELKMREGIRDINVGTYEVSKIQVSGYEEERLRYVKGEGPLIILEIKI